MKKILVTCLSLLPLAGCVPDAIIHAGKTVTGMTSSSVWLHTVKFDQTDDVNNKAAVTVDVLVFYEKKLFEKILKLPSDKYFDQKEQLQKDYPTEMDVFSFEVIPGQRTHDQHVETSRASGVGCIVFAHYTTPGAHRVVVGPNDAILIELDKKDFKVKVVDTDDDE